MLCKDLTIEEEYQSNPTKPEVQRTCDQTSPPQFLLGQFYIVCLKPTTLWECVPPPPWLLSPYALVLLYQHTSPATSEEESLYTVIHTRTLPFPCTFLYPSGTRLVIHTVCLVFAYLLLLEDTHKWKQSFPCSFLPSLILSSPFYPFFSPVSPLPQTSPCSFLPTIVLFLLILFVPLSCFTLTSGQCFHFPSYPLSPLPFHVLFLLPSFTRSLSRHLPFSLLDIYVLSSNISYGISVHIFFLNHWDSRLSAACDLLCPEIIE